MEKSPQSFELYMNSATFLNVQCDWSRNAIRRLRTEGLQAVKSKLIALPLHDAKNVELYLLDESRSPSGSLKHRLARSLFIHALCSGWIGRGSVVVDASSGSTAVSEAYFARLIGLRFVAVLPASTSPEKIAAIEAQGGGWHMVDDPRAIYAEAARIAVETGGHYLDQFTYAESATDWRRDNIAETIFDSMVQQGSAPCRWVVCGAGTGGTSATIGRYIRFAQHTARLCLADPQGSVYHRHHADRTVRMLDGIPSHIEGVGRPRVERSFIPDVIDRVIVVPDAASIAAARHLGRVLGQPCGPSTGMNLHASLELVDEMVHAGVTGAIVTLLCDSGDRYASTCFDDGWMAVRGLSNGVGSTLLQRYLPIPMDDCRVAPSTPRQTGYNVAVT